VVFIAQAGVVIEESLTISNILDGIMILVAVDLLARSYTYAFVSGGAMDSEYRKIQI